jgi:hypothetical protein
MSPAPQGHTYSRTKQLFSPTNQLRYHSKLKIEPLGMLVNLGFGFELPIGKFSEISIVGAKCFWIQSLNKVPK